MSENGHRSRCRAPADLAMSIFQSAHLLPQQLHQTPPPRNQRRAQNSPHRRAQDTLLPGRRSQDCRRVLLHARPTLRYATTGAAFLYGAWGWTLSTSVWRQGTVFERGSLRAMIPYAAPRGTHSWGPAAALKRARKLGSCCLREKCCEQVYCWAGHSARAQPVNPAAPVMC